jgi:hypothetical protein
METQSRQAVAGRAGSRLQDAADCRVLEKNDRLMSLQDLKRRVLCPECGAIRIHHTGSQYAACPNGHGKLVRKYTPAELRAVLIDSLPRAHYINRRTFRIEGHDGFFSYRNGSGRRRAEPDTVPEPGGVVALRETRGRRLVRVYYPKPRLTSISNRLEV